MTLAELQNDKALQIAALHTAYLAIFGAVVWFWLRSSNVAVTPWITIVNFLPALLGLALAFTSRDDLEQYRMRIFACSMFTPLLLLFWSGSLSPDDPSTIRTVWPFATGASVVHALAFVAGVYWVGTETTRIPADPAATAVTLEILRERLLSLSNTGGPLAVSTSPTGELIFETLNRRRSVVLRIDEPNRHVLVKERSSASAARPATPEESNMRAPLSPSYDPKRPQATAIWQSVAQTSTITPEKLNAVRLVLRDHTVELPRDSAAQLNGDSLVVLLCAITTRSGWNWQPRFFGD